MNAKVPHRTGFSALAKAIACALAFAATGAYCGGALAQQAPASPQVSIVQTAQHVSNLEKAFWACDYTATTRGVQSTPVAMCAAVTDELKEAKFGGDFDEMVLWWRQNKTAEFERLAAADQR